MERQVPFFRPGGTMDPSAPSYIERAADAQLLEALLAGEYVFLLDSRQKGKSSLVARTIVKLKEAGVATVKLDLQRIGANVTPEQWYAGLLAGVGQELGLTRELFAFWSENQSVGPLSRWIAAVERVVLALISQPVVIFVDEIDFVRALPFSTDEFFAGIRECYNQRSAVPAFEGLTFCLVGVTTPGRLIRNPEITPFNIGMRIDLSDFTLDDMRGYARHLEQAGRDGLRLLARIHYWTNGHPYLTQLVCQMISLQVTVRSERQLDRSIQGALLTGEARQEEPNYADTERRLLHLEDDRAEAEEHRTLVLTLYGQLLRNKEVSAGAETPQVATLILSGVATHRNGILQIRNRLYGHVFDERWRKRNLPNQEVQRQRAAVRRATLRTGSVAGVVLSVVGGLALFTFKIAVDREQALTALRERSIQLRHESYAGQMASIRTEMQNGQWQRVLAIVDRTRLDPDRGWEWGHASLAVNQQVWESHLPPGSILGLDKQGHLLGIARDGVYKFDGSKPTRTVTYGKTGTPVSVDPASNLVTFRSEENDATWMCNLDSDEHVLDRNDHIKALDVALRRMLILPSRVSKGVELVELDGKKRTIFRATHSVVSDAHFLPDGSWLTYEQGGTVREWNRSGDPVRTIQTGQFSNATFIFSPNHRLYGLVSDGYQTFHIYDVATHRPISVLPGLSAPIRSLCFSSDSRYCACGTLDGVVRVFNIGQQRMVAELVGHAAEVQSCIFLPGDQALASTDRTGRVRVWKLPPKGYVDTYRGYGGQVRTAILTPSRKNLITSGTDGKIVSLNLDNGRRKTIQAEAPDVAPAIHRPRGTDRLDFFRSDGLLVELDPVTLAMVRKIPVGISQVQDKAESLLGGIIAIVGEQRATIIDTKSFTVLQTIKIPTRERLICVALASQGDQVAIGDNSGLIFIYKVSTGALISRLDTRSFSAVRSVAFRPDTKQLAAGGADGLIRLFDLDRKKSCGSLSGHTNRVWNLSYSANSKLLLSSSFDGTARLWRMAGLSQFAAFFHRSWVPSARFSSDGTRVITCSDDGTASVWSADSGYEMITLRGHTKTVWDAVLTDDDRDIVTCSSDGSVNIWHSAPWR